MVMVDETDDTAGGFVRLKSVDAQSTPLPAEDRFRCLPGCGLCCSYRVVVTEGDRRRLQEAGAVPDGSEPWEEGVNGELSLRRPSGFCLFLDAGRRCEVYDHRPQQCRAYPYLRTAYTEAELDVDLSCPGLGRGENASWRQGGTPAESRTKRGRRESSIKELQGLLSAQGRYAAADSLAALGECWVEELASAWAAAPRTGALSARVEETRPLRINIEGSEAAAEVWRSYSLSPRFVEELCSDVRFVGRHFSQPRLNTRLDRGEAVVLYHLSIARNALRVQERGGARSEVSLDHVGQVSWREDAVITRRAYLERWLGRQLPVRLANNLALTGLTTSSHVATCYLQFLTEIDSRLAVLTPALALLRGEDVIRRPVALEAIRASDGFLRAWCESARLGSTD